MAAFAAWLVLMTIGIFTAVLGGSAIAALALIATSFLSLALHGTIVWFNWPKSLVPSARRAEVGTVTESLRRRRDLEAALSEAAVGRSTAVRETDM